MATVVPIIAILTSIGTTTPSFALWQGRTLEKTEPNRFVYYCVSTDPPEAVILPDIVEIETSETNVEDGHNSTQLHPRHATAPVGSRYVSILLNATGLDTADSNCSFVMELNGTFNMRNDKDIIRLGPKGYCLTE